jgi:hypothetical protein
MKAFLGVLILVSLCGGLTSCSAPPAAIDPRLEPAQRDQNQRDMPRPPLDAHPSYEKAIATVDIQIPPATFSHWFAQTGIANLAIFLTGTTGVSGAVRAEALRGSWGKPGDRRRVLFADGNSEIEEILEVGPQVLRYEIWDLTNETGRFITYALAEFTITEVPSGTRLVWTYAFQPKLQPPDGWFIRSYVENDFKSFMRASLAILSQRAVADLAPTIR